MKPVNTLDSVDLIYQGFYDDATPREIKALTSPGIDVTKLEIDIFYRIYSAREYFKSIGKYESN